MKQFEIFWSHIRNFIKKKQLFLIYFFFPIRKSSNTAERLDESGENWAERRDILSEDADVLPGPVSSREIAVCGNVAFSRETLPSLFTPTTRHSPRAQSCSWQPLGQAFRTWSWWHCQLLSWLLNFPGTDKLNVGSRARHGALLLTLTWHPCISPSEDKCTCCKLVLSQTLLSKYLHLVSDKPFPKQGC